MSGIADCWRPATAGTSRSIATLAIVSDVTTASGTGTTPPGSSPLRDLGTALREWATTGVGVVRVLDRHGFGTVESGQLVAGTAAGSVPVSASDPVAEPAAFTTAFTPASTSR